MGRSKRSGRGSGGRSGYCASEEHVGHDVVEPVHQRAHQRLVRDGIHRPGARPSRPHHGRARRPDRHRGGGQRPPRAGAGVRRAAGRSRERKKGRATSDGCTAEHTSWTNPGRVSASVRVPPPRWAHLRTPRPDARPGQGDRRRQPVGTRPDHDGIDGLHAPTLRDRSGTARKRRLSPMGRARPRLRPRPPSGVEQSGDDDHRGGGTDLVEELAVHRANGVRVLDCRHVHPRPHDVGPRRAGLAQPLSMISKQRRACAPASAGHCPSGNTGPEPETRTRFPTRTARLKPKVGSKGDPELTSRRPTTGAILTSRSHGPHLGDILGVRSWALVLGTWSWALGPGHLVLGTWSWALGPGHLVLGTWSWALGWSWGSGSTRRSDGIRRVGPTPESEVARSRGAAPAP